MTSEVAAEWGGESGGTHCIFDYLGLLITSASINLMILHMKMGIGEYNTWLGSCCPETHYERENLNFRGRLTI